MSSHSLNPMRNAMACLLSGLATAGFSSVLPAQGDTIVVNGTRTYYETAGSGRVVVFIHGFALNLREWDDQVKALAPAYRVIAYDRRGFGKSSGVADPSSEPADLLALLDSLGVRSAVLVGHSGGAGVALRFALAHGERVDGLLLYPAVPMPDFPVPPSEPNPMQGMGLIAREHGLDSLFKWIATLPEFQNPPNRPDIDERIRAMTATYSGRDLFEGRANSGPYPQPAFEKVRRLPIPVLFVAGETERAHARLVADSMARWMPNARKVVIPGGGHGVHFAEPQKFNDALLGFLRSLPRPR